MSKLAVRIAVLFEMLLIPTVIGSIASRQWKDLSLSLLAMVSFILPFIFTRFAMKKSIKLPSCFQLITLIFIFMAQYLGEIKKFYLIFWWWDLLLHTIFGSFAVAVALYPIKGTIRKEKATTDHRYTLFTVIFAFSFSIALGTLWEMFEFLGDFLFKSGMVKGGLEDTSTDLLVNILAAFITAVIYYYRGLKETPEK